MTPLDRDALAADLRVAEGLRLTAYQDSVGVWTVGYGKNLQDLTIPVTLAEQWLREAMDAAEQDALTFPWYAELSGRRQRAICELVYNLGLTRLRKFRRTLAAMADGDYAAASQRLMQSLWARQVGPTRARRIAAMIRNG